MPEFHALAIVTVTAAFAVGMLLFLPGTVRDQLAERLNLSSERLNRLGSLIYAALVPFMFLCGMLLDAIGVWPVLLVGSLFSAVAVISLGMIITYKAAVVVAWLLAAGAACLSCVSVVLMQNAFYPDHPAASQNFGNVFFGLGALLIPHLVGGVMNRLKFQNGLAILAVCCLLPALSLAFIPRDALPHTSGSGDLSSVLQDPYLWLCGLVFLLYGPIERFLTARSVAYLAEVGIREKAGNWWLAGFWTAFLGARLGVALLFGTDTFRAGSEAALICVLALAVGVVLGNMAGAGRGGSSGYGLVALGALLGPIFPTLVGVLFDHFTHDRGTAYGVMFSIGSAGSWLLPTVFVGYSRRHSLRRAMWMPMVVAVLLSLAAFFLSLFPRFG